MYGFNDDKSKHEIESISDRLKVVTMTGVVTAPTSFEESIGDSDFGGDDCRNYIPIAISENYSYNQYNTAFSPNVINFGGSIYDVHLYPRIRLYDGVGHQWHFNTYVNSTGNQAYTISIYFLKVR